MNKIIFSLLTVLFSLSTFAKAHSEKWYTCKKDSDCVKSFAVCGSAVGVNKKYKKAYDKYVDAEAELSSCLELSVEEKKKAKEASVLCKAGTCQAG